jgi:hypothetical protein
LDQTAFAQKMLRDGLARWPNSELLRYTFVEPAFVALTSSGAIAPNVAAAGDPALVTKAWAWRRSNFGKLANLDSTLAEASWTAPWGRKPRSCAQNGVRARVMRTCVSASAKKASRSHQRRALE